MASRYAAFAVGDADYLLRTWHSRTRPRSIELDPGQRWNGLEILGTSGGGLLEPTGTVDFQARFVRDGVRGVQRELSRFVREGGRWVYLDAVDR